MEVWISISGFSHMLTALFGGSLCEQLAAQELSWAGTALGVGRGEVKGRGMQPPSYQGWVSQNRTRKHAWE